MANSSALSFTNLNSSELLELSRKLCLTLKLEQDPEGEDSTQDNLERCVSLLQHLSEVTGVGADSSHHSKLLDLNIEDISRLFPAGFETGDPLMDRAASLLRMLFIKDLRNLQTTIDRGIISVQELTANPKTDAKLGKVGH